MRKEARFCKHLLRTLWMPWRNQYLFDEVTDPRARRGRRWQMWGVLTRALFSLCTCRSSLASMEDLSKELSPALCKAFGLRQGRVSDNTFGRILALVDWRELQWRLWWMVRGIRERHQIEHDQLPFRTAALDGKWLYSSKKKMSQYAHGRRCLVADDKGGYERSTRWALQMLRMVTTSTRQRLCFWQEPVPSGTGESRAAQSAVSFLRRMDKCKELVELLTFDAGFLYYEFVSAVRKSGRHWLGTLKANQPNLYAEARCRFDPKRRGAPEYESDLVKDHEFYKRYLIWRDAGIAGWELGDRKGADLAQIWRVEVVRYKRKGSGRGANADLVEHSRHHRYFATSIPAGEVNAKQCLTLVRSHWSIEDDVFNPLDCQWEEDCNFRHSSMESALALSFLRLMALNICTMYRYKKPVRERWDKKLIWMRWKQVFDFFRGAFRGRYPAYVIRSEKLLTT